MVNIKGLSKAAVLAAAHNASAPQGLGFLSAVPGAVTEAEAEERITQSLYIDYYKGRPMKLNLKDDEVDPRLYDRDNGPGAFARVVAVLREG